MNSSAQNKEDLVLIQYFEGKRGGTFIDVGAHDGIQFSNTHLLEEQYGWSGVCIEPNPKSYKQLVKNRPRSQCFQSAVVNRVRHKIPLYVPNGVAVLGSTTPLSKGIGQILGIHPDKVTYTKHAVHAEKLSATLRKADRFNLDMFNKFEYDLLSVDTEWTELDVLKSARLSDYVPEVIVVEANDSNFANEIQVYLEEQNYHLCGFVGGINYFYVNNQSNVNRMSEAIAHVASGRCPNV